MQRLSDKQWIQANRRRFSKMSAKAGWNIRRKAVVRQPTVFLRLGRKLKIHVYSIQRNEVKILPYFLRHYEQYAEKIFVYDDDSTDGSRELLEAHPKVEIRKPPKPLLDDGMFAELYSNEYRKDRTPDWVFMVDADEFIWSPDLIAELEHAKARDMHIIDVLGYEMKHPTFPTTTGQIYEEVKGGRQACWWTRGGRKVCIIDPKIDITIRCGRHWYEMPEHKSVYHPETIKLLHYRDLGYAYYRYHHDRNAERLDPERADKSWGKHNYKPMTADEFLHHWQDIEWVVP